MRGEVDFVDVKELPYPLNEEWTHNYFRDGESIVYYRYRVGIEESQVEIRLLTSDTYLC